MPFLFPYSFMPPVPGVGFVPPSIPVKPSATIDIIVRSQKRGSQECVIDQSKCSKKRRGPRKNSEIVELDDVKEVDL